IWDMFRFNAWATNSPIRMDNDITTSGVAGNTQRKTDVEISRRTLRVFGKGLIRVKVYSVAGRMVGEFEGLNGVEVDLTYPKGVYMVKITSGEGSRVWKVLVK
ncbi:MAG: T9SS type A sorting domain-containing protein, partial [candidate division WOR-3 bacterium]